MAADFTRASCEAVRLLLTQRLYSPKIDVTALCYDKNIIFNTFAGFCENSRVLLSDITESGADGYTIRRDTRGFSIYIVLYNGEIVSKGRKSFTLAHEIGHIYLDHQHDGDDEEAEANRFASELLLPRVLIWELLLKSGFSLSEHELADTFGVSRLAAKNRLSSLRQAKPPVFSDDEAMLLRKFGGLLPHLDGPFIDL